MANDHRGRPVSDNHRSYPRVEAMIRRHLGRELGGAAPDVVKAHQTGGPIELEPGYDSVNTGPVYTSVRPYVGVSERRNRIDAAVNSGYDVLGDSVDARIDSQNRKHEINAAVAASGGPAGFISEAFALRHVNKRKNEEQEEQL